MYGGFSHDRIVDFEIVIDTARYKTAGGSNSNQTLLQLPIIYSLLIIEMFQNIVTSHKKHKYSPTR